MTTSIFCSFDRFLLKVSATGEHVCIKCGRKFPIESNVLLYNKQTTTSIDNDPFFKTAKYDDTLFRVKKVCAECGHDIQSIRRDDDFVKYYTCDNCGKVLKQ